MIDENVAPFWRRATLVAAWVLTLKNFIQFTLIAETALWPEMGSPDVTDFGDALSDGRDDTDFGGIVSDGREVECADANGIQ